MNNGRELRRNKSIGFSAGHQFIVAGRGEQRLHLQGRKERNLADHALRSKCGIVFVNGDGYHRGKLCHSALADKSGLTGGARMIDVRITKGRRKGGGKKDESAAVMRRTCCSWEGGGGRRRR